MARRPRDNDDDISLFPFLSIVACVIGVLTMMIATLALAQTDTPDIAQIEEYEDTQKAIEEQSEAIEELKRKISVSNSAALHLADTQKDLKLSTEELEQLMQELERLDEEIAKQDKVKVVIPQLDPKARETINDMQSQFEAIKEQLAQLETQLKKRQDVPTEAQVTILPQGSGLTFSPHFVECADGTFVMHNLPEPKRVRTADAAKDKDFSALMNLVANGKDDSIVFLVRSDGLGTYWTLRNLCNQNELRNGKIPVVGKGRIDLSVFTKKQKNKK